MHFFLEALGVNYLLFLAGISPASKLSLLNLIPGGDGGRCLARVCGGDGGDNGGDDGGDGGRLGALCRGGGDGIWLLVTLEKADSGDS